MDKSKKSSMACNGDVQKRTFTFSLKSVTTGLFDVLTILKEKNVNVVHIESRQSRKTADKFDFLMTIEDCEDVSIEQLVELLKPHVTNILIYGLTHFSRLEKLGRDTSMDFDGVTWFPRHISDLDMSQRVILQGEQLDADHPGFHDPVYVARRQYFTEIAMTYKARTPIPRIEYTEDEKKTWKTVYTRLSELYKTHACKQYLENLPLLQTFCGYTFDDVPQLEDVSRMLNDRTGFTLRPVAGYLSSRDFLSGLAFRVFHCTQYIRHHTKPFYTPEPDCCHELLGHMPLFLDQEFADFSQEIGLYSLGLSDDEVAKLATCYFFTVEFGLCKQDGAMKVYGAGLLSCVDELLHCLSDEAKVLPFEPAEVAKATAQITKFQDQYYYSENFSDMLQQLRAYCRNEIKRKFDVRYNPYTKTVEVIDSPQMASKAIEDVRQQLSVLSSAIGKMHTKHSSGVLPTIGEHC